MGSAAETAENWVLDSAFGDNHSTSFPDDIYFALFTETPTDAGGGIEVASTGNNYYRAYMPNDNTTWADAVGSVKATVAIVQFPNALEDWGTIVSWGIFDSLDGGTLIVYGDLDLPRGITSGTSPFFAPGDFSVTAD
jgi:hypothetical protein